ncbi:MAG: serine/threonine-protein kinase, partial [Gemmatimonadetes bacterium]|nr:serine/threonine-protein kinase [Gemmatimonadota bacterium]
ELGAGGMATVYLAEDLKHRRKVAVKVLRPELAALLGAERFLKEIEVTANLQHPHILPLHDSGEADGFLYYVMPCVVGESLREKLNREKQLSIEETLEITKAVASALDYAHRHEVIHRDIKPENILLHEGQPMVADFGIALAISAAGGNRLTETGLSLGTPHYMSPEQAMGDRELDARSDVYSLACVTYEMLAGEPPHTGPTAQAIVAKVLTEKPQRLAGQRDTVPPHVDATVHKALEKLPADRFTTARQFAEALTDARMAPAAATLPSTQAVPTVSGAAAWRALGKWMVVLALIFMGVGAALVWVLKPTPQPVVTRFTVPVEGGHEMFLGLWPRLALSPDGRTLVYHAQGRLHVRRLDRFESEPLDGTEGAEIPFFSPDGQWIGFAQGALKKVSVTGGPVTEIMNATADFGASWGGDGTIVYASGIGSSGLWRIPASGGVPERITTVIDSVLETAHIWPQSLAAGKLVLFTVVGPSGGRVDAKIALKDLETGERKTVIEGATYGRYVPTGHIVYVRVAGSTGTIFAVPFDLARRKVTGAEFPVQSGVRVAYWGGTASLAISHSGTVAFVRGSNAMRNLLFWVERDGRRQQLGSAMSGAYPEISPDGRRVAVYLRRPDNDDIFLLDAATGQRDRFTFSTAEDESPVWSPDGGRIAYSSAWTGQTRRIYVKEVDTGAEPVLLYTGPRHLHLTSWSPDGRWLALYEYHPETGEDIYVLPVDSVDHLIPVAVTSAGESDARFSPDGRWLAYESDETGSREVYIVSFPEIGGRQQVSTAGGAQPRWSRDSGELFFWKGYTLMATNVSTQGSFRRETPQPLFDMPDRDLLVFGGYDVTADGQRFLVKVKNPDAPAKEIHVVVNWFEVLRELGESGGN